MEEAIFRIVTELDDSRHSLPCPPISVSSLSDLHSLLSSDDDEDGGDDGDVHPIDRLYGELSAKSLSPSTLVNPLSSAMDSAPPSHSISASKAYLSLILCPNSPVFTLFTPMAFLSLLRSIRRYLKRRPERNPTGHESSAAPPPPPSRKKRSRGGGKKRTRSDRDETETETETETEFEVRVLCSVLERLELAMELIHLDRFPDSLKALVQTISEIPFMAIEVCPNLNNYNRVIEFCSKILIQVLRPEHGDEANTAAEILKSLSPAILQAKSPARTFGLEFSVIQMGKIANRSEGVKRAFLNLPKYLASKAPEKSEARALAVESIMEIVRKMGSDDQMGFVEHVLKMSQGKSNMRLLATDLIPALVMSLRDPQGLKGLWVAKSLEALVERCSDSVAGIRSRALSNLAQIAGFWSGDSQSETVLREVLGIENGEGGLVNSLLRKRCMDEKAVVRKSALVLVAKLTGLFGSGFHGGLLKTMGIACSDPLVSIRKAAVQALSEAFRNSPDESVTIEWLHSVPRLITDNESGIQEECENLFVELVLERICKSKPTNQASLGGSDVNENNFETVFESSLPKGVLGLLKEICNGEVSPWVKKICSSLGKKNKLKHKFSVSLQDIIKTSESLWVSFSMPIEKWTAPAGVWFLLSEVSAFLAKSVDWEFLHHHWKLLDKDSIGETIQKPDMKGVKFENEEDLESNSVSWAGDRVFLLQTISNVSLELPAEPAAELAHNLYKRLDEFNMHSTEVKAHVKALKTLCKRKSSSPEEAEKLVTRWLDPLLSKASKHLEKFISENSEANRSSFSTPARSANNKQSKKAKAMSKLLSQGITAVYTIGSLVIHYPSADMSTIVPLLHTIITSGNSDPKLNKLPGASNSFAQTVPSLYIQAWLTLGKICLADEKLAKRYIPLFVQELQKSDSAALRNNLVVTMADFCIHHTALVDCYITKITKCLRDPCELVRRQTFTLLSRLLQRDYVKWRGVLFLRFLLSLVDESEKIRQLAEFLFGNILKVKAPLLAYNSFIEAIFVLNDCHAHSGHTDSRGSRSENRLFSIRGNDERSRSKRMHIYISLLKQMAPEHLLATFAKLCAEILAAASDGALNINDITGKSVLQDTFQILSCKEIRLTANRGGQSSDSAETDDGDGEGNDATSAAAVRGRAITQAVKKGLIQNTIPIFIELKRLLETQNSPIIGSLMECLRVLLKDYKNEIDEILIADKQLQRELLYDMQKFEAAKVKSAAASSQKVNRDSNNNNNGFQSPRVGSGPHNAELASAVGDVTAAARVRSVLKDVNDNGLFSPPLSNKSVPKLKSRDENNGASARVDRPREVLESLRRIPNFESDGEN